MLEGEETGVSKKGYPMGRQLMARVQQERKSAERGSERGN